MLKIIKEINDFIYDKFGDVKNVTTDSVNELKNKINRLEAMIAKETKKVIK